MEDDVLIADEFENTVINNASALAESNVCFFGYTHTDPQQTSHT